MKIFSYIITHDTGFSPNPFFHYCTLACCKPKIRSNAEIGDWIVGLTSKTMGNKINFSMKVNERTTFDEYYLDSRFANKKPNYEQKKLLYKCGDNIYQPLDNGDYKQLRSMHSSGEDEDMRNKEHDLSVKDVLISNEFIYFGNSAIPLPKHLNFLKVERGHRSGFSDEEIKLFLEFISKYKNGVHSRPHKWLDNDSSWEKFKI